MSLLRFQGTCYGFFWEDSGGKIGKMVFVVDAAFRPPLPYASVVVSFAVSHYSQCGLHEAASVRFSVALCRLEGKFAAGSAGAFEKFPASGWSGGGGEEAGQCFDACGLDVGVDVW